MPRHVAGTSAAMADHGDPRSYLDAEPGIDVVSADGERVGALEHILADDQSDIFDGVVIDVSSGPGGHRFVDAPEVSGFFERAVVLEVAAADVADLPEPSENPAVMQHGGEEDAEGPLAQKLRRAWDLISGRY